MKRKLIWNDINSSRLLSVSTCFFMALSSLLFALTSLLFVNLLGSIDQLMQYARTPDYLQMHAGVIDEEEIASFAEGNEDVEDYQTLRFLNLENSTITLGSRSLADSTQDNGLCVQSERFDYLLDMDNRIIDVDEGYIYVPACYRIEYGLREGDRAQIGDCDFSIAGFLRDSQMNSMMASSKRLLVSESDYEMLKNRGSEEYLIEFLLKDEADPDSFSADYISAGLPVNGPAITKALIRLMNALSDGMMILVILLVSTVMLVISIICIRFTLMTRLASDQKEIGMLKAVGIARRDIRQIYFTKYIVLSIVGMIIGLLIAIISINPLQSKMQELYGAGGNDLSAVLIAILGAAFTQCLILLSVLRTLKRTEKMSTVEAINGRLDYSQKALAAQLFLITFVITAGVFIMAVPQNMNSTISSETFVTYMGIGNAEIRIDIRQTDSIKEKAELVEKLIKDDNKILKNVSLVTKSYPVKTADGTQTNLNVEQGDHTVFPVSYAKGHAPAAPGEIALSSLCARDFGVSCGDEIKLVVDGLEEQYKVCGIYSDITNGGKTAKTAHIEDDAPIMWSIFYVTLNEGEVNKSWIDSFEEKRVNHFFYVIPQPLTLRHSTLTVA